MNHINSLALTLVAVLVGCASTQETRSTPVVETFVSEKSAEGLTICIDTNTDGALLGNLHTNVKSFSSEKFEIVVRNGATIWAVAQMGPAPTGSAAVIRLGGTATMTPATAVKLLTKGCG